MRAYTYQVVRLKHLTLVTHTITVQHKRAIFLAHVLLSETHTCTDRNLSSDDTVASDEGWGEDVHGTTFSKRHADLAIEELANDTFDRATVHDGEAVSGDDAVILADPVLEAN